MLRFFRVCPIDVGHFMLGASAMTIGILTASINQKDEDKAKAKINEGQVELKVNQRVIGHTQLQTARYQFFSEELEKIRLLSPDGPKG